MRLGLKVLLTAGLVFSTSAASASAFCNCVSPNERTIKSDSYQIGEKTCYDEHKRTCKTTEHGSCTKNDEIKEVVINGVKQNVTITLNGQWVDGPKITYCDGVIVEKKSSRSAFVSPDMESLDAFLDMELGLDLQ